MAGHELGHQRDWQDGACWSMMEQISTGWNLQDTPTFCVPYAFHPSSYFFVPLASLPYCNFKTSLCPSKPPQPISLFSRPFITSLSPYTLLCSQPVYCLWPLQLGTWAAKTTKTRSRFWR